MKKNQFFLGLSILLTLTGLSGALVILHGVITGGQYTGSLFQSLQNENLMGLFAVFCIIYLLGVLVFCLIPKKDS